MFTDHEKGADWLGNHGLDEKAPKGELGDKPPENNCKEHVYLQSDATRCTCPEPPVQWRQTDAQGNPDVNGQYVSPVQEKGDSATSGQDPNKAEHIHECNTMGVHKTCICVFCGESFPNGRWGETPKRFTVEQARQKCPNLFYL